MSVLPDYQRKGIGSALIKESLIIAKALGFTSVIVLGHKDYYPVFGFAPADRWGIETPFPVPREAFMACELCENALSQVKGKVVYPKEFFQ